MQEFKLPDLGEGMQEAEVVEWLVKVGDTLKLDQTMLKVETDKAVVEIPSPVAGRVAEIRVQDGQVAKVGDVLIVFDSKTSANGGGSTPTQSFTSGSATIQSASIPSPIAVSQTTATKQRVLAAPAVRKLAFELGIDLEKVTPSLPNGRVSIEDVRSYVEHEKASSLPSASSPVLVEEKETEHPVSQAPTTLIHKIEHPVTPVQDERQPLKGLRKRIAEHMERSWHTIPHATTFDGVDGSALATLREALKPIAEKRGVRLTYIPLLIKLLIPLLKEFPIFNASLVEENREIIYHRSYHIGVATASPEGLLVPVMRNADYITLMEIASNLEHLIEGAKKRTLALSELSGSTFTLNNVGSFGGSTGTPIINHPEVAILAVGRLQDKAIVQQGVVIVRPMMPLALSFDHRLIDGAMAGAFLARFKELVENPQQLMLDMV
ncbi:MAG TPA: dihydrolipoamide acetyltransferase family protein [Ktedonobacteraceae bacterium]|nr:dihydrolipoamide acetyltransferase family protein [Ktedonobacteraceae bacterium]